MLKLAEQGFVNFAQKYVGKTLDVLVETEWPQGGWEGHTDNYLRVILTEEVNKGEIVPVRIKSVEKKICPR